MALPQLSAEDRKANLEKAAAARKARALVRTDLKAGKITAAAVLELADEPVYGRMKVVTLLESLPKFGKARAAALMAEVKISQTRRVQGLGANQREALLKALA